MKRGLPRCAAYVLGLVPMACFAKLRQVEVMIGQGTSMADAIRSILVTEVTYYRWRSEYGGMKLD